jgi:hypothetical protein
LYAGEALDISDQVIEGLNADYLDEKSGKTVKKDSTAVK